MLRLRVRGWRRFPGTLRGVASGGGGKGPGARIEGVKEGGGTGIDGDREGQGDRDADASPLSPFQVNVPDITGKM